MKRKKRFKCFFLKIFDVFCLKIEKLFITLLGLLKETFQGREKKERVINNILI